MDGAVNTAPGISERHNTELVDHWLQLRVFSDNLVDLALVELASEVGYDFTQDTNDLFATKGVVDSGR